MLRVVFHPHGMRRLIVNWPEVGGQLLSAPSGRWAPTAKPRRDTARGDAGLAVHVPSAADRAPHVRPGDLLLPVHIRHDELELRLFSTIMTLGTPQDVTLQELRIETLFPADESSERQWRLLVAGE